MVIVFAPYGADEILILLANYDLMDAMLLVKEEYVFQGWSDS